MNDHFDGLILGAFLLAVMTVVITIGVNCYAGGQIDKEKALAITKAKAEAIKSGADPLAVSCAFDGASQLCAVLVARK